MGEKGKWKWQGAFTNLSGAGRGRLVPEKCGWASLSNEARLGDRDAEDSGHDGDVIRLDHRSHPVPE